MNELFEGLEPFLNQIVSVVISIIGIVGVNLLLKLKNWVSAKMGATEFNKAKDVAEGLWYVIEDKYDVSGMGEQKKVEMEAKLLEMFPNLSKTELDSINKIVHENIANRVKEVQLLENVTEEVKDA